MPWRPGQREIFRSAKLNNQKSGHPQAQQAALCCGHVCDSTHSPGQCVGLFFAHTARGWRHPAISDGGLCKVRRLRAGNRPLPVSETLSRNSETSTRARPPSFTAFTAFTIHHSPGVHTGATVRRELPVSGSAWKEPRPGGLARLSTCARARVESSACAAGAGAAGWGLPAIQRRGDLPDTRNKGSQSKTGEQTGEQTRT